MEAWSRRSQNGGPTSPRPGVKPRVDELEDHLRHQIADLNAAASQPEAF
jgi:hypothetical protein